MPTNHHLLLLCPQKVRSVVGWVWHTQASRTIISLYCVLRQYVLYWVGCGMLINNHLLALCPQEVHSVIGWVWHVH